jgi:hypothetical protein
MFSESTIREYHSHGVPFRVGELARRPPPNLYEDLHNPSPLDDCRRRLLKPSLSLSLASSSSSSSSLSPSGPFSPSSLAPSGSSGFSSLFSSPSSSSCPHTRALINRREEEREKKDGKSSIFSNLIKEDLYQAPPSTTPGSKYPVDVQSDSEL